MRQLFSQLIQSAKDACIDDTTATFTGLSDAETFLKREINNTNTYLFSLLREYKLEPPPYTESTVANRTYYSFRPGVSKLVSATIQLGSITPPLTIVQSQEEWDRLQEVPITSSFPTHIFPKRDTYGIYPTPQSAYTLTLTCNWIPINMTGTPYTTGTIALTNGDETVVGDGSTFTSSMIGKWVVPTVDGVPSQNIYRIGSFTDDTHLELDRKVIDSTASELTYIIDSSPEIPEELHEFIPYRAASIYYLLRRKDIAQAKALLNFFYTGDVDNPNRKGNIKGGILAVLKDLKEKGRGNSQIVETGSTRKTNFIRDGIWGITLS